jgi:hypothetical protein
MQLTVNDGTFQLLPEGLYAATLVRFVDEGEGPDPFNPGETRHRVKLIWGVILPDGTKTEFWDWAAASLHSKSKLFKIAKALLGKAPKPGTMIDTDSLVGQSARIQIEHYQSKAGERARIATYLAASNNNIHNLDVSDDDLPENLQ